MYSFCEQVLDCEPLGALVFNEINGGGTVFAHRRPNVFTLLYSAESHGWVLLERPCFHWSCFLTRVAQDPPWELDPLATQRTRHVKNTSESSRPDVLVGLSRTDCMRKHT